MSSESDKPSAVRVHIVVAGEEEGTTFDDVHYCGKCKLVFSNIKDYLEHKVLHDSCQVTYSRSSNYRRMFVPNVVPKKNVKNKEDAGATQTCQEEKKPVQKRVSSQQKAVDESLITQKFTYSCSVCCKEFNRVAALKRHLEYDHKLQQDTDPFSESSQTPGTDDEQEGGAEENREEDYEPVAKKSRSRRTAAHGNKPHVCEICGNKFKEASVLKTHMLIHTNERMFPCTVYGCDYSFKTKGSLTRHLRRHTGEKPYSCNLCGRSFSESGALTRHLKSRTPCKNKSDTDLPRYGKRWGFDQPVPSDGQTPVSVPAPSSIPQVVIEGCEEKTGEEGARKAEVEDSQGEKNGEETVNPDINSKGNTVELGEEIIGASFEKITLPVPYQLPENTCRVCELSCDSVKELKSHLRLHLADTSFRCELCHYVADSQEQLIHHQQNIHVHKPRQERVSVAIAQVPDDSSSATSEKTLRHAKLAVQQLLEVQGYGSEVSARSVNQGEKAAYTCPICQKSLRGQSYIHQHMKTHTGERPFKCMQCEKTFTCRDTLTKHVAVHTEERQYKCGECGKLFKRISHVREHLKSHSGERPFQCNVCEKTFKTANAAKVHSRTHSDVLPYECLHCHKFFREKGSLQRHVRMHTGEKPFKCKHCGRAFAEHGTLGRHLKAKVPCTYFPQGENKSQEGYPTVLAEFSSVVADTQQYIVPDTLPVSTASQDTHGQLSTELVVVQASEIPVDQIQNVEIIASGMGGEETVVLNHMEDVEESSQYVVLGEPGDDLRVLDPHTCQTVATVPAHMVSMAQEEGDIEALIMNPDNDVEGVVMNSDHPYPQDFQLGVMDSSSQAIHDSQVQTVKIIDAGNGVQTLRISKAGGGLQTFRISEDERGVQTVGISEDESGVQTMGISEDESGVQTVGISEDESGVQTMGISEDGSGVQTVRISENLSGVQSLGISEDGNGVQSVGINEDGSGAQNMRINEDGRGAQTLRIDKDGNDEQTVRISKERSCEQNQRIIETRSGVQNVRIIEDGSGVQNVRMGEDRIGTRISEAEDVVQTVSMNEEGSGVEAVGMNQACDLIRQDGTCVETIVMISAEHMDVTDSIEQVILQGTSRPGENTQGHPTDLAGNTVQEQPAGLGENITQGQPVGMEGNTTQQQSVGLGGNTTQGQPVSLEGNTTQGQLTGVGGNTTKVQPAGLDGNTTQWQSTGLGHNTQGQPTGLGGNITQGRPVGLANSSCTTDASPQAGPGATQS